jgi:hypothetical protein
MIETAAPAETVLPPGAASDEQPAPELGQTAAQQGSRGLSRQDVFSALGALGAVITLVTAVLFYFGWRRSDVQAGAMSIDVSLFGFSSQDYVLRSISSLYLPLLVVSGLGLCWLWVHLRITRLLRSDRLAADRSRAAAAAWTRLAAAALAALAACCVLFTAATGLESPPPGVNALARRLVDDQWAVPLVLLVTTTTAAYLWWVHRQLSPARTASPLPLWQTLLPAALLAGIVLLGGFWLLEEYASAVGRGRAQEVARGVDRLARTVVLSPTPLGIDAPGVREERLGEPGSPEVRYRTTGVRLLARSGGKVLLVHDGWSPTTGTVIVLPDRDDLGWQFSR